MHDELSTIWVRIATCAVVPESIPTSVNSLRRLTKRFKCMTGINAVAIQMNTSVTLHATEWFSFRFHSTFGEKGKNMKISSLILPFTISDTLFFLFIAHSTFAGNSAATYSIQFIENWNVHRYCFVPIKCVHVIEHRQNIILKKIAVYLQNRISTCMKYKYVIQQPTSLTIFHEKVEKSRRKCGEEISSKWNCFAYLYISRMPLAYLRNPMHTK